MLVKLKALVWPVTRAKLHRLVTLVGVAFAILAVVLVWAGQLGLSTEGKIGATIGMLTTLAAGWQRVRPKLDAGIDALPIPDDDATATSTAAPGALIPAPSMEITGPPARSVPFSESAAPLPSSTPTPVTVDIRPKP